MISSQRKRSAPASKQQATHLNQSSSPPNGNVVWRTSLSWGAVLATLVWFVTSTSLGCRVHLVMGYATVPAGPPQLELFLASWSTWALTAPIAAGWLWIALRVLRNRECEPRRAFQAIGAWGAAGAVPMFANLLRVGEFPLAPNYWEVMWLSAFSGVGGGLLAVQWSAAMRRLEGQDEIQSETQDVVQGARNSIEGVSTRRVERRWRKERRWWEVSAIALAVGLVTVWWYVQSSYYHANYLLGFNDFGHFAQRVANTAAGRGVLLETPVLPMFWDHFNPGLIALVPLWKLFPTAHLFFALQAVSLSVGAIAVWAMARRLEFDRFSALVMGLAWLVQPVLGQMNVAYTYGWHPISLAIPFMLAALWSLLAHRPWLALACSLCAMSMEEGVIAVVALFCAGCTAQLLWLGTKSRAQDEVADRQVLGLSATLWSVAAAFAVVAFLVVYRFSGIAEFQTGRFVALGNTALEVLFSPVMRPSAFWGAIFRWDKLAFCLSLWLPCFLPAVLLGWRWMLPTVLPLMVLIVWDHKPATSLAFQYSSTLLPLFWLAAMAGGQHAPRLSSVGALTTGLVMSLYVGQMPYSSPTLLDVIGHTYGIAGDELERPQVRNAKDPDGQWLTTQVLKIRLDQSEVLATGRVAAHLVGNRDVETVGQYIERRDRLSKLADRKGTPIKHYRWIILDRQESFQQTSENIDAVEREALAAGFQISAEQFGIVVLEPSTTE